MRIETYRGKLQDATKAEKYATRFETGPRKRIDQREQRAVRQIFGDLTDCRTVVDVPSGAGSHGAELWRPSILKISWISDTTVCFHAYCNLGTYLITIDTKEADKNPVSKKLSDELLEPKKG